MHLYLPRFMGIPQIKTQICSAYIPGFSHFCLSGMLVLWENDFANTLDLYETISRFQYLTTF